MTESLLLSHFMMRKLGPERLYNLLRANVSNWKTGCWQFSLRTWIQVPISPSYSLCDLGHMGSFLWNCFLICPLRIMQPKPRVRWHNVCKSDLSTCRCLCKGRDSWFLLLGDDSAGLSYKIRKITFGSPPQLQWEQRGDRIWGVREPEGPGQARESLAWGTEGAVAAVTNMGILGKGQLEKVTRWLGRPGLMWLWDIQGVTYRRQLGIEHGAGDSCRSCQCRDRTCRPRSGWSHWFICL